LEVTKEEIKKSFLISNSSFFRHHGYLKQTRAVEELKYCKKKPREEKNPSPFRFQHVADPFAFGLEGTKKGTLFCLSEETDFTQFLYPLESRGEGGLLL
jgi:hypothetical protein